MVYDRITTGLDARTLDRVDALLGDEEAAARGRAADMDVILAAGGDIG